MKTFFDQDRRKTANQKYETNESIRVVPQCQAFHLVTNKEQNQIARALELLVNRRAIDGLVHRLHFALIDKAK